MKKLFYVMIISLAVLALNSCQKEKSDQPEATPESLLSQNSEFAQLQAKCNSMTKEDVIAILEKNGEMVDNSGISPIGKETTDLKSTNEPVPGSFTLSAEVDYNTIVKNGIPVIISLMKWHWNIGGTVCAADYAGPGWVYHIKYYWMDVNTGVIHGIRTRGNSCITDGTGSQDNYWRTQNMKIVAILGKWYIYNSATGEELVTSGAYIPSDPIIANVKK